MQRDQCRVEYDRDNRRLVYIGNDADERHWDAHWTNRLSENDVKRANKLVVSWTTKYLRCGSKVLDGGCGVANTVFGLKAAGYEAWGVDFASETVAAINRVAPELDVIEADVHALPFDDNSFDGIWSLGVIEHFPGGYDGIACEMRRVLKHGGYAFITVPTMSPMRRWKAARGAYSAFRGSYDNFYQFVLPGSTVVEDFERIGFSLKRTAPLAGLKGLKDEWDSGRPFLQFLYDSRALPARVVRRVLGEALTPLTYHTKLFVFQKV